MRVTVKELSGFGDPWITPTDHPLVAAASLALARVYGQDPALIRAGGSVGAVEAMRRRLGQPRRLGLYSRQSQLGQGRGQGPVDEPLLVQPGAVLLLASLNHPRAQPLPGRRLPYEAFNANIERHVAHPLQVADLARDGGF